jgi:hypothetical protein
MEIPRVGLDELLGSWTGDGQVFDAVAACGDDDYAWSSADIRHRSRRVLLELVAEHLDLWPRKPDEWARHLPITVEAERLRLRVPTGSIRWAETARRYGWPPRGYVAAHRRHSPDDVAVSALRWLVGALKGALADVAADARRLAARVRPAIEAADVALTRLPGPYRTAVAPDRAVLRSLITSGAPWRDVAHVAELVHRSETDLRFLAFRLILPDPATHGRLFHLATFGALLSQLRGEGCTWRWTRPIRASTSGPQVEVRGAGGTWDLWFEAGAARSRYDAGAQPYQEAVAHVPGVGGPIGADVALIDQRHRILLLECKWSADPEYVGRVGFHQAASYALDARAGLAPEVWSFVVGPAEVVPRRGVSLLTWADHRIALGAMSVLDLPEVLAAFLKGDPADLRDL